MLEMAKWQNGFDGQIPIYRQIASRFARSVVRGELAPGDRVPSIRDTAVALKVNANTVQRAYQEMERNLMIFSQRGTGYFVMRDDGMVGRIRAEMVREHTARFLEEMRALGFDDAGILDALKDAVEGAGSPGAARVSAEAATAPSGTAAGGGNGRGDFLGGYAEREGI
jgi:GntR family transcriptional regulator